MMFVVSNRDCFVSNKDCHSANTGQINNLHFHPVNLTVFKMGVYYSGVKYSNSVHLKLKRFHMIIRNSKKV